LRGTGDSPRTFIPFYKGSELRAYRLHDYKLHFITAGAYGQPPARELHSVPLLIDLKKDIAEEKNITSENAELVQTIIDHAERFKDTLRVQPSLLDQQFSIP
jgi:hypothetical protein